MRYPQLTPTEAAEVYKRRNDRIKEEWRNRYREGQRPIRLRDLAERYEVTITRIHQIINK